MTTPADAAVVAAVGPSEESMQVVRLAAREAAAQGRSLSLLHAFNWEAAFDSTGAVTRTDAEELIERAAAAANDAEPAVPVSGEIVEGSPVQALIRRSESAYLVALGDGGMAGCGACVPADAPAVQVAARADCPVLVVRPQPPPAGPVLVGVDGSASSQTALAFAFDCADRRSARVLAIRVLEPGRHDGEQVLVQAVARAARRHPAVAAECHTIEGDPGTVLLEQSRSAQLAVVGARGDEPWRGMLGAVSQSLLYHSPCPVIVVRGSVSSPPDGA